MTVAGLQVPGPLMGGPARMMSPNADWGTRTAHSPERSYSVVSRQYSQPHGSAGL